MSGPRLLPALAALVGFVLAAEALRPLVPLPEGDAVRARFAHLASDEARYDVVVLGASTVLRGFDPAAFDGALAERGQAVRSFNLGVPGAFQFELDYLLEQLLARSATPPRFVLLELQPRRLDALVPPANRLTDRAVYWHAPRQTRDWFVSVARSSEPDPGAASRLETLRHAAWRWSSLGQGDRILLRALRVGADARAADVREAARTRGYRPFPVGPDAPQSDLRDQLLGDPAWFRGVVARIDAKNARPPPRRVLDPAWLRAQRERARAHGTTLLYVLTPTIQLTAEVHALHRSGAMPDLLALDSPRRHPELYLPENRFDPIHLNEHGARLFSRALAGRFVDWLGSQGGRPSETSAADLRGAGRPS